LITLESVCKKFYLEKSEIDAVDDVSLHIEKGEIYGIIGYSGAGKSTLVRCINLLEVPTSGKVVVNGQDLTGMTEKDLRKARQKIGMIFQHFNLMRSRTVFANIAYPLRHSKLSKAEVKKKVRDLLQLVGMEEKENAYPSQLSGGQKQRVAIARALANDPMVLLCDEATSALDPQTTHSILQLLRELNQRLGLTVVIITHEMAVIKEICHKVAVMENGNVVEAGDVFSIFSSPKQPITQEFIRSTSNLSKVYELIANDSAVVRLKENEQILRLTYVQKNVSEPIISEAARRFGIDLNIIFGDIEIIQDAPLGGLVVIVSGGRAQVGECIDYLREKNVRVEVIADGISGKIDS